MSALTSSEAAAVHPNTRLLRYHTWTRRLLQRWTVRRVLSERSRYARCVDLGCGPGDWSELFAPHCDELHACDSDPKLLAKARERMPSPHVHITRCDVRTYEPPVDVDLVFLGAVLMYLPDDDALRLLRRLQAAAVPGALIVIRDYLTIHLGRPSVNKDDGFSVHRSPEQLRALVERAGFTWIETHSSLQMYAEVLGGKYFTWPVRALWELISAPWTRASYTLLFRTI